MPSKSHGLSESKIYYVWHHMLRRCRDPRLDCFKNYGGRGISVCDEWLVFEKFLEDMGIPESGMTLDRIDNNKGYSKENCRWATRTEQSRNRRNNIYHDVDGKKFSIKELADKAGITYRAMHKRLGKMSVEEALLNDK